MQGAGTRGLGHAWKGACRDPADRGGRSLQVGLCRVSRSMGSEESLTIALEGMQPPRPRPHPQHVPRVQAMRIVDAWRCGPTHIDRTPSPHTPPHRRGAAVALLLGPSIPSPRPCLLRVRARRRIASAAAAVPPVIWKNEAAVPAAAPRVRAIASIQVLQRLVPEPGACILNQRAARQRQAALLKGNVSISTLLLPAATTAAPARLPPPRRIPDRTRPDRLTVHTHSSHTQHLAKVVVIRGGSPVRAYSKAGCPY